MRVLISAGFSAFLAIGAAAADAPPAAPKPDEVIAARQAGFDLMAAAFAPLKPAVAAGEDPKPYVATAKAIAAWAAVIPTLFPVGTESGRDTAAKPEIWSDRQGFVSAAANLGDAARKLAQLADAGDKSGFAAQFEVTAKACGDCHKTYKVKHP
jgi:cytochrome c556